DPLGAAGAQDACEQREPVPKAGADDDELRVGDDPARATEVLGERLSQLESSARVAVAEARGGCAGEAAPECARPRRVRERRQVGQPWMEAEPRRTCGLGCRPGGGGRARGA